MAIPIIIALNAVSPAMQQLTSAMKYTAIRSISSKTEAFDLNQAIRNISNNIYTTLYGDRKGHIINNELINIRSESDVDHTLRFLDYIPSVNPIIDVVEKGYNKFLDNALAYLTDKYKNQFIQILPYVLRATNEYTTNKLDYMLLSIASDNVFFNTIHSLLNEMLPSSNYKKSFYYLRKLVKSNLDQERQDYRTAMPNHIKKLFNNAYSTDQWKSLSQSVAHTNLSTFSEEHRSVVFDYISQGKQTIENDLYNRFSNFTDYINVIKSQIKGNNINYLNNPNLIKTYVQALAEYLATNHIHNQKSFFKNSYAICANLFGSWFINDLTGQTQQELVHQVEELVSLQSLLSLSDEDFTNLQKTITQDKEALNKVLNMLQEFKRNEDKKIDLNSNEGKRAKLNSWEGYLPTAVLAGSSIRIGRKSEIKSYLSDSYALVKKVNTNGTNLDTRYYLDENDNLHSTKDELYYFYSSMPRRSAFNEGALSIVLPTYLGNNLGTGHIDNNPQLMPISHVMEEAGEYERYDDKLEDDALAMIPVFTVDQGTLSIQSYDLFINDDQVMKKLEFQDTLPEMMGFWAGRQKEEQVAEAYNMTCLDLLLKSFDPLRKSQYVDIMDPRQLNKVQRDAVNQIPWHVRVLGSKMFKDKYGMDGIWVRKDILKDVIGQRSASVMDVFNGINNLPPAVENGIRACLKAIFGNQAYNIAVGVEQSIQGLVSEARRIIVIKSCKVMMLNNFGNIWQLIANGVPISYILKEIPKLLKESETYAQYGFEYQRLIVERDTTNDPMKKQKIQAQIDMLDNKVKSLSIAPILSEFSTINDLGMDTDDIELMKGKVASWVSKQINKLPQSVIVAGKHIVWTRDTPESQFLEKATQYGDFIAKGILYNYMTKYQHRSAEEARYRVLDEFVNYDMLAGRTRSYLESLGILWFYNYKLRIMKTAARMVQEHPLRALIVASTSQWSPVGDAGDVLSDSLLGKLLSGDLVFTFGWGMLFRGLMMHPLLALLF